MTMGFANCLSLKNWSEQASPRIWSIALWR